MEPKKLCDFTTKIIFVFYLFFSFSLQKKANAQITPDNTFGNEKTTVNSSTDNNSISNLIEGGAVRGANLFHSFLQFNTTSVNQNIYFENPQGITNIIARVTGSDASNIMGILGVNGNANLFLLNPNGIVFGSNSALDLKGSFLATTANAIKFNNQGLFDVSTPSPPPSLTVNPSGFLFTRTNISPIINRSNKIVDTRTRKLPFIAETKVNLFGLKVPNGQSLVLLGGDIVMDNGGLNALGGEIEIGSVSGTGLVGLSYNGNNFRLSFPQDISRGNVYFLRGAKVDTSGNGFNGGNVRVIGKNIQIKDNSQIISFTQEQEKGGILSLDATDIIEILDFTSGGKISTQNSSSDVAGEIKISAKKLFIDKGAAITSTTFANGNGGKISINTNESIELKSNSNISSATAAVGGGGNIVITTPNLVVSDGAFVTSGSTARLLNGTIVSATGDGGNIDIISDNSVRIDGGRLLAQSQGTGKAGKIKIYAKSLEVIKGTIEIFSSKGQAGNLEVIANSLTLDGGTLNAKTGGSGANITLQIRDLLRLENESLISARASGNADGGSITINTGVLLALPPTGPNGSDIIASAEFGEGGNITVNAKGIFGITERKEFEGNLTNDIDASSQFGQSGQVQINTTTNPNQGLVELPATVVDPSALVAQNPCKRASSSEFTRSGRGGLPPSLSQDLNSETTQVGLVEPVNVSASNPEPKLASKEAKSQPLTSSQIAPAQGWVYNDKGEVVLVAYNSAITGPQRLQSNPKGCPVL
jgi:filamentous hemagglutinin family protein